MELESIIRQMGLPPNPNTYNHSNTNCHSKDMGLNFRPPGDFLSLMGRDFQISNPVLKTFETL